MAMFHTIKSAGTAASEEMASEYYEVKARGAGSKRLLPRRPRIQPVLLTFSQKKWNVKGDKDSTPDFASSEEMEEILVKSKPE